MQAAKPTIEQRLAKAAADGKLGPEDYIRVITSVLGFDEGWFEFEQDISDAARADMLNQFNLMDEDGNGLLSVEELMHVLCTDVATFIISRLAAHYTLIPFLMPSY
jgi:hypothetical protein